MDGKKTNALGTASMVVALAQSLHGGADDQRHTGGYRAFRTGCGKRDLRTRTRLSPGRDSHSHADTRDSWRGCESCRTGVDPVSAGAVFGAMTAARDEREREAVGAAAGGAGDCDADPGGAGDMDAPDGASDGAAAAVHSSSST